MHSNSGSRRGWVFVALVALLYAAAYVWTLTTFRGETSLQTEIFGQPDASPDHVVLRLDVMEIDPIVQEISLRIIPEARGQLLATDGVSVAHALVLDLQDARASFGSRLAEGHSEIVFPAGRTMAPLDVTVMLEGGSVDRYPFDRYLVDFVVNVSRRDPESPSGFRGVPVVIRAGLAVAGFALKGRERTATGTGRDGVAAVSADSVSLELEVERSATAFWFSIFLMLIVGALALACAAVSVWVAVLGRRLEPQFFTWMAGTLFAIVGLRSVLPGNPPLGALPDFLVFIWAESIVALALLCIVAVYLRRKPSA
jgi:Domain of unknown function (DUF4436)